MPEKAGKENQQTINIATLNARIKYMTSISSAASSAAGPIGIATGLYNFADSIFDFGSKEGPSFSEQLNHNLTAEMRMSARKWDDIAAGAKKHGINMLTALGVAPSTPSYQYGTPQRPQVNTNHLNKAFSAGVDRSNSVGLSAQERTLQELAIENASLGNDFLRVQIAGAQKALTNTGLPPAYPDPSMQSQKDDLGLSVSIPPAFMTYSLGNGKTAKVINPELAESLEGMPLPAAYSKMAEIYGKRTASEIMDAMAERNTANTSWFAKKWAEGLKQGQANRNKVKKLFQGNYSKSNPK